MGIESIALCELCSNLIIGRDSALKYSYCTTWQRPAALITLMSPSKEFLIRLPEYIYLLITFFVYSSPKMAQ